MSKEKDTRLNFAQELDEFTKSIENKSIEELTKLEEEIIKEADALNNEIAKTTFKVKKDGYKENAQYIRDLLDKIEVQWQYCENLCEIYDFWTPKNVRNEITFGLLDSTLRQLGALSFKGYAEWKKVCDVNTYLTEMKDEYVATSMKVYNVASRHDVVMKLIEKKDTLETPITVNENAEA